jgi:hypothetical protein
MSTAGLIGSNLRESLQSADEELSLAPEQEAYLRAQRTVERELTNEELEEVDRQYCLAYAAAEKFRWGDQDKWQGRENEEMRLTNILHPHAIFRKLQRAGVDARIEAPHFYVWQIDDHTGRPVSVKRERSVGRIWLHDDAIMGRVGVSAFVWDKGQRIRRCVTSLQYPYGPEWSIMRFDEWNVPTNERYRGWRTAMLQMILAGVLTESEVERAFGPVPFNDSSWFYRRTLADERIRRMGIKL